MLPDRVYQFLEILEYVHVTRDQAVQFFGSQQAYIHALNHYLFSLVITTEDKFMVLSPEGKDALARETRVRQQRAKDEIDKQAKAEAEEKHRRKDARRTWLIWLATAVLEIAIFLLGALLEQGTGFVERVLAWFQ